MPTIHACPLPERALLSTYRANGSFTDCYAVEVAGTVSQAQFVTTFHTTLVFHVLLGFHKLYSRVLLRAAIARL